LSGYYPKIQRRSPGFAGVAVYIILILLGAYISLREWQKKLDEHPQVKEQALADELKGLAKLAEAIKGYPVGQQLIVWGIVIIIIGALFGGVSGMLAAKAC
jgi:predicted PurR-regulated permease PerM